MLQNLIFGAFAADLCTERHRIRGRGASGERIRGGVTALSHSAVGSGVPRADLGERLLSVAKRVDGHAFDDELRAVCFVSIIANEPAIG